MGLAEESRTWDYQVPAAIMLLLVSVAALAIDKPNGIATIAICVLVMLEQVIFLLKLVFPGKLE